MDEGRCAVQMALWVETTKKGLRIEIFSKMGYLEAALEGDGLRLGYGVEWLAGHAFRLFATS